MVSKSDYSLREISRKDLELVLSWRNSERIRNLSYNDQPISMQDHVKWYEKLQYKERVCLLFEIDGRPVGVIQFFDFSPKDRKCKWGFYLGEENLPRGAGSIMGKLAINYAFEHFDVDTICGEALSHNESSIRFHKKLGFLEDGRLERGLFRNDRWLDIYLFSLARTNWHGGITCEK